MVVDPHDTGHTGKAYQVVHQRVFAWVSLHTARQYLLNHARRLGLFQALPAQLLWRVAV